MPINRVLCMIQHANFGGYDCILLEDCTATTSPDFSHGGDVHNVRQCFGFVISSDNQAGALSLLPKL